MPKTVRFETAYDFKVMYEPPKDIPRVDLFPRPGQKNLPCLEDGHLTLWLHEGTDVGEAEGLAEMLNRYVRVVAYGVPPHKPLPPGYEDIAR